jgi:protein-S-isoprenylcysteine O-methyltransferase Ste14
MQKNNPAIENLLLNPLMDRFGALFIAAVHVEVLLNHKGRFSFVYLLFLITHLTVIATFLTRRPAQRIETNPWIWALTWARVYWPVIFLFMAGPSGISIVDYRITNMIAGAILILTIYSRWCLGRSVGAFPANRSIVTHGAYGFVRHPIQSLGMLMFINYFLAYTSWRTGIGTVIGVVILTSKSFAEERFLSKDEEYRTYQQNVRWKFIPFVV